MGQTHARLEQTATNVPLEERGYRFPRETLAGSQLGKEIIDAAIHVENPEGDRHVMQFRDVPATAELLERFVDEYTLRYSACRFDVRADRSIERLLLEIVARALTSACGS